MRYKISTQPETTRQLIIRSLRLYGFAFSKVILLALALSITNFIPELLGFITNIDVFYTSSLLSSQRFGLLLAYVVSLLLFTAILWRIRCLIRHAHETVEDDLKIALKKIPSILIAVIVQAFIFILASLATVSFYTYLLQHHGDFIFSTNRFLNFIMLLFFSLPFLFNIFITVLFLFYLPLILTENMGVISSLKQSANLVWKKWWRTLLVQAIPLVCYLAILYVINRHTVIKIPVDFFLPGTPPTLLAVLIHLLLLALFIPWVAATLLVQLRDLELRKKLSP